MPNKFILIGVGTLVAVGFLAWLYIQSTKPLPGEKIADLGRGHEPVGTEIKYNSNPPTSGPHYEEWVRAGVYSEPKDDRNLVHSLEHGYVILSYKCNLESSFQSLESSESAKEASPSGKLDSQEDCDQRKSQLEDVFNSKKQRKLIVVPRPNLDTNFALTAWTYLDKFDNFESSRVESFIDAHRDNGPERTME